MDKQSSGSHPAILVVDDNRDNTEIVRQVLERNGYAVHVAHDGEQALGVFETVRPPVVLLDVMMPGRSGWDVCRVMKQHPDHGKHVRVIMMTALGDWNDKQQAIQTGADDYITKPIDFRDLAERVQRNLALVSTPP
jgi:DNA-binding response OmpR family regulator